MKKTRIITGVIAAAAAAVALTACGSSASEFSGTSTASQAVAAKDYNGFFKHTAEVYKDYVTLGDYTNIEIDEIDRSNEDITDETLETNIQALETEYTLQEDVTSGGTTQADDIITLDYSGSIDGVEFEGGTATDQTYTVGSLRFIEDLDEGLKGKNANTEYEIPVKFPDDYSSEELKGKDAVFKVTITNIMRPTVPTIDDAWVSAHTKELADKGYGNVSTLAELKEGIKASLKAAAVESNNSKILSAALEKLKETSTFKGYPEAEVSEIETNIKNNIDSEFQQYKQYMSMMTTSVETEASAEETAEGETTASTEATTTTQDEEQMFLDYIKQYYGLNSQEEYDTYAHDYAEDYVGNKMLVTLIGDSQGFTASVDEIVERGEELAAAYGYDNYQSIIDTYGAAVNCDTGYQTIYAKVAEFMAGKVKEVPASTEESGEATEAAAEGSESAESTEATSETVESTESTESTEATETTTQQ